MRLRERFERVREMVRKEFLQIFRDPRLSRVIFVAPVIQLTIFGYAVSTDVRNTSTYVVDFDKTRASRALIDAFTASGYFRLVGRSDRPAELVRALDRGKATVGIEIPYGFAVSLYDGSGAEVQVLLDGTNSNIATVAKGYAERIIQNFGQNFGQSVGEKYGARAGAAEPSTLVDLRERAWFNPDLASRNYNVPAVVGAIILLVCLLLTALAVVREREIGTLEQLMVSPLTPGEMIIGKTVPFAVIGLVDLGVVTTVALLWFGVPFEGDALLLLAASILFLLSGLGAGLLISTISNTQQEAFMASFLIFMPAILLSGFVFPVSSMPPLFQWLTLVNPVRHYLEIVRAIFLKGAGLEALWPQYLALSGMGAGLL
ncbi:MAG TPA: ABC transporter permease, partial [Nitrospiria bacterium]|nr:ABC transporter permease [Nitrospiria bacterium]